MKEIQYQQIVNAVSDLCQRANFDLGEDVVKSLETSLASEVSPTGRDILKQILQNAEIARTDRVPLCQDTGFAVFIVELGQEVHVVGGNLNDAINEGVRKGYGEGYLRKSICHPITRKNTGDNTPAIIHLEMVAGDKMKIHMAAKGGGSENMSFLKMLKPSDGIEGIKNFILESVRQAGPNPCPPIVVGVGIGGTFEKVAYLAKKSLFRKVGERNPDPELADLELELLEKVNKIGIGPQGMGGITTALDVHVEMHPAHIASLPVAVNINCHSYRHKEIVL